MEVYTSVEICRSTGVCKVAAVLVLFGAHKPAGAPMMLGAHMDMLVGV